MTAKKYQSRDLQAPDIQEKIAEKEENLQDRLEKLEALEQQIREREKRARDAEMRRKQIVLRIPNSLWEELARWAQEDFRSINGQIEYLLAGCVRQHRSGKNMEKKDNDK